MPGPETYRLTDVIAIERIKRQDLQAWIEQRWVLPVQQDGEWWFDAVDLARVRLVKSLIDDMEIDRETVPILLSLIDQVHHMRARLSQLAAAVGKQPDPVRRAILEGLNETTD